LLAPLAKSAGGSPVFDRNGGLVAIIAQSIGDPKLVAGVAPLAPHKAIGVADIQRFLSLTSEAPSKAGEMRRAAPARSPPPSAPMSWRFPAVDEQA